MTRSRASAKSAGTVLETVVSRYLAVHVDDRIERRARNGAKDRGDVGGVRILRGGRMVLECKDVVSVSLGAWYSEAEKERGNDDAMCCAVVHKRKGKGQPGDQWVTMTVDDLVALLTGDRPSEDAA